jgi:glycolate oxidase iron-sulfur subunit
VEIPESDLCCGSAGTYNIEQPVIAARLGARKAGFILDSGVDAIAMGNIGCMVQIKKHLYGASRNIPVYHTIQLLDLAYRDNG